MNPHVIIFLAVFWAVVVVGMATAPAPAHGHCKSVQESVKKPGAVIGQIRFRITCEGRF